MIARLQEIAAIIIMCACAYLMLHGIAAQQELTEQRNHRLFTEATK